MRLESFVWLFIVLVLCVSGMIFVWGDIAHFYNPYRSENLTDPFSKYAIEVKEIENIQSDMDADIYDTNRTFTDAVDKYTGGALTSISRIKAGYKGVSNMTDMATSEAGIGAGSGFNLPQYIMIFLGITILMGIVYMFFRIRSW